MRPRSDPRTLAWVVLIGGCGASAPMPTTVASPAAAETGDESSPPLAEDRQRPPESGPSQDIAFPAMNRSRTETGLEINCVPAGQLPVVYLRLVVKTGGAADPPRIPGLASMVAQMLEEGGTRSYTSAELAEAVEFLGADLRIGSDSETLSVMIRALSDQLTPAMELLAEVAMRPRFDGVELRRLKRRERDRLALSARQPRYVARRTFYREVYGEHPYAHVDTTIEALGRVRRADLSRWHRTYMAPNNAMLIAVGDVEPAQVEAEASRAFRGWRKRPAQTVRYQAPPSRSSRQIIVVDRPESVQSVIYAGNLALARSNDDYIPLLVANQVLGGSAASRLFMDLRERRSLTYGAYSFVQESPQVGPFVAYAAVRNAVTAEAMTGLVEHLTKIVEEAPPEPELHAAQRFLSDSFPLRIETPGRIALMVQELRTYGLPDDYWTTYRSAIRQVDPGEALRAARTYIRPADMLIVAVGRASAIVEPLRHFGPVRVEGLDGTFIQSFDETTSPAEAAPSTPRTGG